MAETRLRLKKDHKNLISNLERRHKTESKLVTPAGIDNVQKKLEHAKMVNEHFQKKIKDKEHIITSMIKNEEVKRIFKEYNTKLNNVFLSYRHLQNTS